MATWAIGDIQGCYETLRRLLERIPCDARDDRLWLVGDLVNRGPRSLKVLRLVQSMGSTAIVTLGNHDLHLLAVASGAQRRHVSKDLKRVLKAKDSDKLLNWLRRRPLIHHDKSLDFTLGGTGKDRTC